MLLSIILASRVCILATLVVVLILLLARVLLLLWLVCIRDDAYNDTMMGSARITLHSSRSHFNLR